MQISPCLHSITPVRSTYSTWSTLL